MQCKIIHIFVLSIIYIIGLLIINKMILHEDKEQIGSKFMYSRSNPENDTELPLIFVGGVPRSGTTLMRCMLEAHHDIRCGPETHVLPWLLDGISKWRSSEDKTCQLLRDGVEPYPLDAAVSHFVLEIIKHHAPSKRFYCNKDPLLLLNMIYLNKLFPNAKFIYMARDGRASAHSIVSRTVTITGVNSSSYRSVLQYWNNVSEQIYGSCNILGDTTCLLVHYEMLVLQPLKTTKRIFEFLDINWCPEVLHHEKHITNTLSNFERSTDQVQKPLYLQALSSWFGEIPHDVERDMEKIAPMLKILGYDPNDPAPNYGEPDDFILGRVKY